MYISLVITVFGQFLKGMVSTELAVNCDSRAQSNSSDIMTTYDRLYKNILKRPAVTYKMAPDAQHCTEAFPISFKLKVIDINELDELSQVMTQLVYLEIIWTQKDLSWNISEYEGMERIWIESKHIWTPHILILLGQKDSTILEINNRLKLFHNGTIVSTTPNYLSFSCAIDFHRYPFDQQTCNYGLLVLNFYRPKIEIRADELSLTDIVSTHGEWRLKKVEYEVMEKTNTMDAYPRFMFTVKRQRTYYVITVIFPMILTSVMIPLVFLIPARTGEKISYLVSIFTSTAIFLNFISDVMPRGLSTTPYLAGILLEVLVEGLMATLASLLVINKFEKEEEQTRERQAQQMKVYPGIKPTHKEDRSLDLDVGKIPGGPLRDATSGYGRCSWTSRRLDIIFFILFTTGQTAFLSVMFCVLDWVKD